MRIRMPGPLNVYHGIEVGFGDERLLVIDEDGTIHGTLSALDKVISDEFEGDLTGDVTGDVTGDLTGNVTGNVTGNLTGNVAGNVVGNVTGNLTGNVTGNVTGGVTGNVTGNLTGNVAGSVGSEEAPGSFYGYGYGRFNGYVNQLPEETVAAEMQAAPEGHFYISRSSSGGVILVDDTGPLGTIAVTPFST